MDGSSVIVAPSTRAMGIQHVSLATKSPIAAATWDLGIWALVAPCLPVNVNGLCD